jgi:hypothetical protein
MKQFMFAVAISFVFFSLFTVNSFAQRGAGWGAGSQYNKMFDVNTVETITGEVVNVKKITPMKGMSNGIHLLVKTSKETISVHLGPSRFIDEQKLKINRKDKVTIIGSRITYQGNPAIIASEIIKGNETIIFRDKNGYPVWSGSRRK